MIVAEEVFKYMVNVFGKDDDGERGAGDQYKNTGIVLYTPSVPKWLWDCWCAVKYEVVDNS